LKSNGRSFNTREAKLEYEPHQIQWHKTGENCEISASFNGLPVQTASEGSPGKTGYRSSKAQNGNLCTRLFLAPPSRLQEYDYAKNQY